LTAFTVTVLNERSLAEACDNHTHSRFTELSFGELMLPFTGCSDTPLLLMR
jgi:hypothetical protein